MEIRAYMAHPIRGAKGPAATREEKAANNQRAIEFAVHCRRAFPSLDLWVPAEHEEFMQHAEDLGILDNARILAVDRRIVARRDILIVYAPDGIISAGMYEEIAVAQAMSKLWGLTQGSLGPIHRLLGGLLR